MQSLQIWDFQRSKNSHKPLLWNTLATTIKFYKILRLVAQGLLKPSVKYFIVFGVQTK
jgi:hypothetical protein